MRRHKWLKVRRSQMKHCIVAAVRCHPRDCFPAAMACAASLISLTRWESHVWNISPVWSKYSNSLSYGRLCPYHCSHFDLFSAPPSPHTQRHYGW